MKLPELIEEYLTERDLEDVLGKLNLNRSGSKKELFERVLNGIEGKSAREVLSLFSNDLLTRICKAKGIERDWPFFSDLNEQMMKKICSSVLGEDMKQFESGQPRKKEMPIPIKERHHEPDKFIPKKPEIKAPSPPIGIDSGFEEVVRDIQEWFPKSNCRGEDDLNSWLTARKHSTVMGKGDSVVDGIVDDKYPIVLIIEPKLADFHRAFGQIHRHLEKFHSVIMLIYRPKPDGELEFFEERVRRSLTYSKHPYKIIRKK